MKIFAFLFSVILGICNFNLATNIDSQHIYNDNVFAKNTESCCKPGALAPALSYYNPYSNMTFISDYFAPYYFKNLRGNFGYNLKGSCSYVAVDMLLSFYDSYWSDGFLPENFDGEKEVVGETVLNTTNSPGSINEKDFPEIGTSYSNAEYLDLIEDYCDQILHLNLISIGVNNYNTYDSSSSLPLATWLSTMKDIIYDYLDDSTILSRNSVHVGFDNQNSSNMRNTIIQKVTNGIPVVVDARKPTGGAHSFVVYDYDADNDELYANAGWYDSQTYHIGMSNLGYTIIQEILYIEPNISHSHSYNYQRYEEGELTNICACSSVIPTSITITNNYLDTLPTFKWNSLIKEKWFQNIGLHHEFSILRSNHYEVFTIEDIYNNKVTLNSTNWGTAINIATPYYYAYVGLVSDVDPYWDDYYCLQLFREPNRYLNKSSFLPSDWGLAARYYFSNELDSYHLSIEPERRYTTATINGLTVTTDRLRCGYIEQSYVVLSPRRENAGRAYFEMNFNTAVYSFMYRACMWSSSENLDGIAIIQTKNSSGVWTTLKDIPISSLPTKANGVAQFVEQTSQGIYGLGFETTATATGTRNKGRLCLDDIVFSTQSGAQNNSYTSFDYSTKN